MGGDIAKEIAMSKNMQNYFLDLQKEIDKAYNIAKKARKIGLDPEQK